MAEKINSYNPSQEKISDLPPPELPFYEDLQQNIQNTNPNLNNNEGYSSASNIYSNSNNIYDTQQNINNNVLKEKPSVVDSCPTYLPTTKDMITSNQPGNKDKTTPENSSSISNDPLSVLKEDEGKEQSLLVKNFDSFKLTKSYQSFCETKELVGLILNLVVWIWLTLLILSYVGIIYFPRKYLLSGSISTFDFNGFGSSGGNDVVGFIFLIIFIIILIIILIFLMPSIYPEFIFLVLYLAYLYFQFDSVHFKSQNYNSPARKVYLAFMFLTFGSLYKFFAITFCDI